LCARLRGTAEWCEAGGSGVSPVSSAQNRRAPGVAQALGARRVVRGRGFRGVPHLKRPESTSTRGCPSPRCSMKKGGEEEIYSCITYYHISCQRAGRLPYASPTFAWRATIRCVAVSLIWPDAAEGHPLLGPAAYVMLQHVQTAPHATEHIVLALLQGDGWFDDHLHLHLLGAH